MLYSSVVLALLLLFPILALRLLAILPSRRPTPFRTRKPGTPTHLLIVLGSGGHTAEMLMLIRSLDTLKYNRRTYIVSSGDSFSEGKAHEFEKRLSDLCESSEGVGEYEIAVVPRARKIHQSLLTTPFSSLQCLFSCLSVLRLWGHPDLIISNGPGTGVIVVLASLLLRYIGVSGRGGKMRTVYVESWARVRRLSLSGRILLRLVDRFVVQWEVLKEAVGAKAEFLGVLV